MSAAPVHFASVAMQPTGALNRLRPLTVALIVTAAALAMRTAYFDRPILPDEAAAFHQRIAGSGQTISLDDLPLFNVIFVWMRDALGMQIPALRWPAFAAGILCVPLVYLVGRRLVGAPAAFLAALILAFSSAAIDASTAARGDSLTMFLGLIVPATCLALTRSAATRLGARQFALELMAGISAACALASLGDVAWSIPIVGMTIALLMPHRHHHSIDRTHQVAAARIAAITVLFALLIHSITVTPDTAAADSILHRTTVAEIALLDSAAAGIMPPMLFFTAIGVGMAYLFARHRVQAVVLATAMLLPLMASQIGNTVSATRTLMLILPPMALAAGVGLRQGVHLVTRLIEYDARQHDRRHVTTALIAIGLVLFASSSPPVSVSGSAWHSSACPDLSAVARFVTQELSPDAPIFTEEPLRTTLEYHLSMLGGDADRVTAQRPDSGRFVMVTTADHAPAYDTDNAVVLFDYQRVQVIEMFQSDRSMLTAIQTAHQEMKP